MRNDIVGAGGRIGAVGIFGAAASCTHLDLSGQNLCSGPPGPGPGMCNETCHAS